MIQLCTLEIVPLSYCGRIVPFPVHMLREAQKLYADQTVINQV